MSVREIHTIREGRGGRGRSQRAGRKASRPPETRSQCLQATQVQNASKLRYLETSVNFVRVTDTLSIVDTLRST